MQKNCQIFVILFEIVYTEHTLKKSRTNLFENIFPEKLTRARRKIESLVASYGCSLLGISNIAGTDLL